MGVKWLEFLLLRLLLIHFTSSSFTYILGESRHMHENLDIMKFHTCIFIDGLYYERNDCN